MSPDGDGSPDRSRVERLDDPRIYRYVSGEELRHFLDPTPAWRVADLGSGTGRFANEIGPIVETVYAIDIDPGMHAYYRGKGIPPSVRPVVADLTDLPLGTSVLDGAVSIRTFHHGVAEGLAEIARVLRPGGRFVVVDWSGSAAGLFDHEPDPGEHYDLPTVQSMLLDHGFRIHHGEQRWETFAVVAERGSAPSDAE